MKTISLFKVSAVCVLLAALIVLMSLGALTIGSADYSLKQIADAVIYGAEGPVQIVVYNLRLPRIIMALEVGACLAVAGALLQSVMRNPLADPGIIGVSAGGGTGCYNHTSALSGHAFGGAAVCFRWCIAGMRFNLYFSVARRR